MSKLKSSLIWVMFFLCLAASFGLGYFVRGTADTDAATSYTEKTDVTTQNSEELHATDTSQTATPAQTTAFSQTTAPLQTTPTAKPHQTANTSATTAARMTSPVVVTYILNTSSKKIHYSTCTYARNIADKNRREYTGDYNELLDNNNKYTLCSFCFK